ncbi:hypothetical protein A2U01_0077191, partial [Trifolium medium]|nr:hypothetical protein [Trifolium medium]
MISDDDGEKGLTEV